MGARPGGDRRAARRKRLTPSGARPTAIFTRVQRRISPLLALVPIVALLAIVVIVLALLAFGGLGSGADSTAEVGVEGSDADAVSKLGFPSTASRNTIRIGGGDPAVDAAAVASAIYPGTSKENRPSAVVLVDAENWQGGVAAAVLAGDPLRAPLLLADDGDLPDVTEEALQRLAPRGADLAKGAQLIPIGDAPDVGEDLKVERLGGKDAFEQAAAIDRFSAIARGERSPNVIVVSADRPEYAMPAAAWSAFSGDAVLFTETDRLPKVTEVAIDRHERPDIYVLGPPAAVSSKVAEQLGKHGRVKRIGADTPVETAVEFARFQSGDFGWGIEVPGYNFALARTNRPMDAAAGALLASNGVFAPLLLTDESNRIPSALDGYLRDIQPGFDEDPREGVYNRIWILGDDGAISRRVQGQLDRLLELIPADEDRE